MGDITVYTVVFPVTSPDDSAERIKDPGTRFAVADMKLCATATTSDYSALDWQLKDVDDRSFTYFNTQTNAREPDVSDTRSIAGGDCSRGWLTFQVAEGATLDEIIYAPFDGEPLTWDLG